LPKITILIGFSFVELSTVDSTNNYAMGLVHEGMASHGVAIFAHAQTAGKGQRGKQWNTEAGANIILSILVDASPIRHLPPFALSAATALAAYDLFTRYAVHETSIKWPNDIYWRDRKAAGILIENAYYGKEWQWAVIGIGLNVNQVRFPDLPRPPVSLKQITGRDFDAPLLARELCALMEERWQALRAGGAEPMMDQYQEHLFGLGRPVRLRRDGYVFDTQVIGVLPDGRLRTSGAAERSRTGSADAAGSEQYFSIGEVEWMFDH
jgi:BirA family biotin operon repressor/biotin-[acetyl-CoA-carboxylase] ligase